MQKWEYIYIIRERGWEKNGHAGKWVTKFYPPQGEVGNDPDDFMAALGEQGWELVSAWPVSSYLGGHNTNVGSDDFAGFSDQEKWVFKRPK